MPGYYLNPTNTAAKRMNHLDGGPLNKGESRFEITDGPDGFWETMGTSPKNLMEHGILPDAADRWTVDLLRGDVPSVDERNKPHRYESMEEFFEHVSPLVQRISRSRGKEKVPLGG